MFLGKNKTNRYNYKHLGMTWPAFLWFAVGSSLTTHFATWDTVSVCWDMVRSGSLHTKCLLFNLAQMWEAFHQKETNTVLSWSLSVLWFTFLDHWRTTSAATQHFNMFCNVSITINLIHFTLKTTQQIHLSSSLQLIDNNSYDRSLLKSQMQVLLTHQEGLFSVALDQWTRPHRVMIPEGSYHRVFFFSSQVIWQDDLSVYS